MLRRFTVTAGLLALALTLGMAFANSEGIRVSGTGTVYGAPDTAMFTVGINTLSADVTEATEESNAVANAIITALTEAGVDEADIRTSSFNVFREDRQGDDGEALDAQFRVINTVTVTVRNTDSTGDLLSLALANGANQVDNLQFTISNTDELRSEARALAVQDARERAEQLAELAGVELGAPVFIEEFQSGYMPMSARQSFAFAEAASVPIEAGELSVSVDVNIVFAINTAWNPLR